MADVSDPATAAMRDVGDIGDDHVSALREWFRLYKTAEGKGENHFGLGEEAKGAAFAAKVAGQTHALWRALNAGTKACDFDGKPCWTYVTNLVEGAGHEAPSGEL